MPQHARSTEAVVALLEAFIARRSEAHAALALTFESQIRERFLLDLPTSGTLAGGWSFQKHGGGARLASPSGEIIEISRLDRYRDGEIIPFEFSEYLESVGVDVLEIDGDRVDAQREEDITRMASRLEAVGRARRTESGWELAK